MAYTNCDLILSVKDADDRDEWLKVRNMGIGGSDASVIMGLNSYKSPYQLWLEKIGEATPEDLTGNPFVYWGQKNEANIADWFNEETGKKGTAARHSTKQRVSIHDCECRQNGYRRKCRT